MVDSTDGPEEKNWTPDVRDILLAAGLTGVGVGCWFVWAPLSVLVPGAVLTYVAIFGVR